MPFFKKDLLRVKAFVFDSDGVLSRPEIIIDHEGNLLRTASVRDGYAIRTATTLGFPIAIITGGVFEQIKSRYLGLGVKKIYLGSRDKVKDLNDFTTTYSIEPKSIMYMGDDIPDIEVMKRVGIPVCPADAVPEIQQLSKYISDKKGGYGCVRDVIEQVLRAQKKW